METKVNVWKTNVTNGLILALFGIVYQLIMYFFDLSLNKTQGYVFMIIQVVMLFFLLKSFRDNFMHGQITYGQAVGAGVIICLYFAVIMAVFSYILFTVIDTGLVAKQLAQAEEAMRAKGTLTDAQIETAMGFTAKIMKPVILSISGIFMNMIWGTVISLVVSVFVKKEGNPLIDTVEN
jgi:Protein of unknown function (DUF4199)